MLAHDITYPSTLGVVVAGVRSFLTGNGWTGATAVTTTPKLPDVKTARMVTVRDDGGTGRNGLSPRRHGFNVWADTPVGAENLAIAVANCCRASFTALEVSDPVEVTDSTDDVMVVGGKKLTHYFLSAVLLVRARDL